MFLFFIDPPVYRVDAPRIVVRVYHDLPRFTSSRTSLPVYPAVYHLPQSKAVLVDGRLFR